jgi:hypothetical protein
MRKSILSLAVVGLLAAPALADVTVTPLGGSLGSYMSNGQYGAWSYNFVPGGGVGNAKRDLYDNVPPFAGGLATPGLFPGTIGTVPGTWLFVDWVGTSARYGDGIHEISAVFPGPGPAVITQIWYAYSNNFGTAPHFIKIYDMVPPSVYPGVFTSVTYGATLWSGFYPGMPSGQNAVLLTGLSIPLISSSIWINFNDPGGPGLFNTFWLTGGYPALAVSDSGLTYTYPYGFPPNYPNYYLYIPFPGGLQFGNNTFTAPNIALGLGGYHIPAPGAISLLGLAGLVALRRRRVR